MKITFCGAAGIVTGSCYLIEFGSNKYLVDCGMFQGEGSEEKNESNFPFDASEISGVFLTHAHIDHSGMLPKLRKKGFHNKIYATPATTDLCKVMLEDSAHVQESEANDENKIRKKESRPLINPIYSINDAKQTQKLFNKVNYGKKLKIDSNVSVRFRDAGHIVGSSIIELFIKDNGEEKKLVFSGDLGQWNSILVKSPELIEKGDYVFIESTYGDKLHEPFKKSLDTLKKAINHTYKKGGKLIIPSFAVERTQQLIYAFKMLQKNKEFPKEKVFLDSPLAIRVTNIFDKYHEVFNENLKGIKNPFNFQGFKTTQPVGESKKINSYGKPCIIIAGSGMVTGGRVKHHLKHNIGDKKNAVLFVGYQAEGTPGRDIIEGVKNIEIMGDNIPIKSKIYKIESLSAHADYKELIRWLEGFVEKPKKVFIVHGERESSEAFKKKLDKKGYSSYVPSFREKVEL
jgi:metallo-beta-lactamase family protein